MKRDNLPGKKDFISKRNDVETLSDAVKIQIFLLVYQSKYVYCWNV